MVPRIDSIISNETLTSSESPPINKKTGSLFDQIKVRQVVNEILITTQVYENHLSSRLSLKEAIKEIPSDMQLMTLDEQETFLKNLKTKSFERFIELAHKTGKQFKSFKEFVQFVNKHTLPKWRD